MEQWHIVDPSGIKLGAACENYVNHERNVATTMDPIYLVVAMIPCVKLWPWLGQQIEADTVYALCVLGYGVFRSNTIANNVDRLMFKETMTK